MQTTEDQHGSSEESTNNEQNNESKWILLSCVRLIYSRRGILLTFLAAVCFSLQAAMVKSLTAKFGPFSVIVLYIPVASIASSVLLVFKGVRPPKGASSYLWLATTGIAVVMLNSCNVWALTYMALADIITIGQSSVVIAGIFGFLFLREPLRLVNIISAAMSVCGVVFVARPSFIFGLSENQPPGYDPLRGTVLALAVAITIATLYILVKKQHTVGIHPLVAAVSNTAVCFLVTIPLSMAFSDWSCLSVGDILLHVATGMAYFVGQISMYEALSTESATVVAILFTSKVAFGFLSQILFFSAVPGWTSGVGAALITSACILTIILKKTNQNHQSEEEAAI